MRSNLRSLYPAIYNDVRETGILADAGDVQFNQWFMEMDDARRNQFVLTADVRGIELFERIYEIKADPATEGLEFRRDRILNRMQMRIPFTFRFLLRRLDELIGKDKYRAWLGKGQWNYKLGSWALGREPFRAPEYTLFIETVTENINWYHEVQIFVNRIKPANIVYILSPLVAGGMEISETISATPRKWNYRLGKWKLGNKPYLSDMADTPAEWNYKLGRFRLGQNPFGTEPVMEVIKLPETSSITSLFLNLHARYTAAEIVAVRLNQVYTINEIDKRVNGHMTDLRYSVTPASGLRNITQIELLNENGDVLDCAGVFVPVPAADQLTFKHFISHREVANNG